MIIYLDNCCFNRPFDDQRYLSIKIETECKLFIQQAIKEGKLILCWSYILDFENHQNPFLERKIQIQEWKNIALKDTEETTEILKIVKTFTALGFKPLDALHLACAVEMKSDYFITVDKGILKVSEKYYLLKLYLLLIL